MFAYTGSCSDQEEADTKVFLHTYKILKETNNDYVVIRSHSWDRDILVLGVSLLPEGGRIFLDNGTEQSRKLIWYGNFEFSTGRINAPLGFHVFTGNVYNASFFRKSKVMCWNILADNSKFIATYSALGEHLEISNFLNNSVLCIGTMRSLLIVCGAKCLKRNNVGRIKLPDLSTFPPCHQVWQYHIKRPNAIIFIWKQSLALTVVIQILLRVDGKQTVTFTG